jgi:hypothetical protein
MRPVLSSLLIGTSPQKPTARQTVRFLLKNMGVMVMHVDAVATPGEEREAV